MVAMPKLVISRALGMHHAFIALNPRAQGPRALVQMPYIPGAVI